MRNLNLDFLPESIFLVIFDLPEETGVGRKNMAENKEIEEQEVILMYYPDQDIYKEP